MIGDDQRDAKASAEQDTTVGMAPEGSSKKRSRPSSREKKPAIRKVRSKVSPRLFPRESLDRALSIARAIRDKNGGKPWTPQDIATAIKLSTTSTTFFYVAAASRDYGLTDGSRETPTIGLTELGRKLVYPSSAEEEMAARLEAFRSVEVFAKVLGHYGGNRLPELQYVKNTLQRDFNVDEQYHEDFVDLFRANCVFVGLKDGQGIGESVPRERRTGTSTRKDDVAGTITLAEPNEADTGLCFVIMPFAEKNPNRPKNFFNEVLTRLITPACVDAGFRVVTADRRGSDVIHSTIVNSLLDADLVVADLTDHNRNIHEVTPKEGAGVSLTDLFALFQEARQEKLLQPAGVGR